MLIIETIPKLFEAIKLINWIAAFQIKKEFLYFVASKYWIPKLFLGASQFIWKPPKMHIQYFIFNIHIFTNGSMGGNHFVQLFCDQCQEIIFWMKKRNFGQAIVQWRKKPTVYRPLISILRLSSTFTDNRFCSRKMILNKSEIFVHWSKPR